MSDQERDKHLKATDDEGGDEVEAHKHHGREANTEADTDADDDSNDVEAHKHHGRD